MGLFRASTQAETDVEKATDEKNTKEEWGLIMEVCDKAGKTPAAAKEYMKAIIKRMNNQDPHIAIQAVTLLDACIKNCGLIFHIEIASREFENEYCKLIKKSHPQVNKRLRESLEKWASNEFKTDPQLNLIPSLYSKLKNTGVDFHFEENPKRSIQLSKDPNVVQSQDEEDQIAKAIELSLKETSGAGGGGGGGGSPNITSNNTASYNSSSNSAGATSLYPSTNVSAMPTVKEQRKVRALYDFVAAEDNELTFNAGEIIFIIDDSDPNWWKGSNQRGEGLFPANFVTTDLSIDPDQLMEEKKKKIELLDDSLDKQLDDIKEEVTEIDEEKIDRLLHLLHEADPTNPEYDTKEMLGLEREVNSMGTLIDKELEKVDRKHAQLTQLSSDLVEALGLYHSLMREPQFPGIATMKQPGFPHPGAAAAGGPPPNHLPPQMMFNGNVQSHQQPPPHPSMMYNTLPHDRNFMQGPPSGPNMMPPNHYNTLPPGGMNQHPGQNQGPPQQQQSQQQPNMPPMSAPPPNMPPQMQPPPPHMTNIPPQTQNDPRAFPPQVSYNGYPGVANPQIGTYTSLPPPTSNIM